MNPGACDDLALVQTPGWGRECPPYALAALAAFVRRAGYTVSCFDLNNAFYHAAEAVRPMWDDKDYYSFWEDRDRVAELIADNEALLDSFVDRVLAGGARVVGFSTHTTSFLVSLEMARRIKEKDPSRLVVFGGPQCSRAQAGRPFAEEDSVDAVAVGEGEETLTAILAAVRATGRIPAMPGLILRTPGGVRDCGDRDLIKDLGSLPVPDYSDFAPDIAGRRYNAPNRLDILESRGCVRTCHFCSEWQFWRRFRTMDGRRMFAEVRAQIERFPGVDRFYFIGSLLNGAPRHLEVFCDLVLESGLKISWEGQAIFGPSMTDALIRKMARAGCSWLGFGAESGSERLRRLMNKPYTNAEAFRVLRSAKRAGIRCQVNIMFGLPGETREDFEETIAFLALVRPHIDSVLASQSFTVLDKETTLYTQAERFGIEGREHHLYWTADGGANDYAERFRRYEEFCRFALELGLPETSGVLRTKPDKWMLLGNYYRHRKDHARALRCFRRSERFEGPSAAAREGLREARAALRPQKLVVETP